jgi:hypothetical protein
LHATPANGGRNVQDLRYGARTLLKNKLLTFVAILSLGVGIGGNTAVFSVANALLMKKVAGKKR